MVQDYTRRAALAGIGVNGLIGAGLVFLARNKTTRPELPDWVRMEPRVSVLDHGAKGDGLHDDSAAVQRAIAAVAATGGAVTFPGGRSYLLDAQITLCDNLALIGLGQHARLVVGRTFARPTRPLFKSFSGTDYIAPKQPVARRNIAMLDLEIDGGDRGIPGRTLPATAMRGAMLCVGGWDVGSGAENILIRGCFLHSFAGAGVMLWKSSNIAITGNRIENFFADDALSLGSGIDLHEVSGAEISGNRITHNAAGMSWHGMVVLDWHNGSSDVRIEKNLITDLNGGDGISCEGNDGTGSNLLRSTIFENTITRCKGQGISVDNCQSVIVKNNKIDQVSGPGIIFSGTISANIIKNTISNSGLGGIISQWGTTDANIIGNHISDIKYHDGEFRGDGINVTATDSKTLLKLNVKSNTISKTDGTGIYSTPATGNLSLNKIYESGKYTGLDKTLRSGIVSAAPAIVENNFIESMGLTCFAISSGGSNFPSIRTNDFSGKFENEYYYIGYRENKYLGISITIEDATYEAHANVFRGRFLGTPPGYWYKGDTFFTTTRVEATSPRVVVVQTPSQWRHER